MSQGNAIVQPADSSMCKASPHAHQPLQWMRAEEITRRVTVINVWYALQVVREGSKRVLNMRPFDVQLIGGMILHEGEIAEMRTGEGKTLVSVS